MNDPAQLWRAALPPDPGRPFLTYYDDATGERVELSFTTTDNWVAKTVNLLRGEIGTEPGERIALALPTHWQTAVWYLACWAAGVIAAPGADPADCDHAVADPDRVDRTAGCPGARVLVPLRPLGARAEQLPTGVLDYAAEVPGQADTYLPGAAGGSAPALLRDGMLHDGDAVVAEALAAAASWALSRGSRVLMTADLATGIGLRAGLLAPLAVGASVVLCRNPDEARMPGRMSDERVTHRLPHPRG